MVYRALFDSAELRRQLLSFAVVGAVGFVVDSTALVGALHLGLGPYLGRLVSYLASVTTTWALNRRFTFARSPGQATRGGLAAQWARFALSQLSGATVNLSSYALLVYAVGVVARHPVIGVAVGSLAGMFTNFTAARRYVFSSAAR
jgi:putative flippase GtrA